MSNHILANTCGNLLFNALTEQYFEGFLWLIIKNVAVVYFGKKAVSFVKWWMCGVTFKNLIR